MELKSFFFILSQSASKSKKVGESAVDKNLWKLINVNYFLFIFSWTFFNFYVQFPEHLYEMSTLVPQTEYGILLLPISVKDFKIRLHDLRTGLRKWCFWTARLSTFLMNYFISSFFLLSFRLPCPNLYYQTLRRFKLLKFR